MNRATHYILLIFTLFSSHSFAAQMNQRYIVNALDWPPVAAFYDTQTSTTPAQDSEFANYRWAPSGPETERIGILNCPPKAKS